MKPHEKLGVAIANAGYDWTAEMRSAWEELDKEVTKRESEWQTTSNYSQLVLRTNEALINEVQALRKAQEK